ncbi:proline-rich nuclear receptor coactivator 2-like [Phlebotomus argentipes]|uniref:proline-rich nuclear receptor coactivator 2-like n=1 Tax=Phlebotomus argentipes TaxID=94469 RepID=UPI002892BABF|nr:proline-rich nuclear receptor coactivator 2-like [Phlebotomus argentipes]
MTNSQNRPSSGGNRYSGGGQFSPSQQHQHTKAPQGHGGSASAMTPGQSKGGASGRKPRSQRSPSGTTYFASQSTLFFTPVKPKNPSSQPVTPMGAQMSSSPPNLSHFAGSKCYEAPAPTALPRPPDHWKVPPAKGLPRKVTTIATSPSKSCGGVLSDAKSDIFSHNLKMLLNIKA